MTVKRIAFVSLVASLVLTGFVVTTAWADPDKSKSNSKNSLIPVSGSSMLQAASLVKDTVAKTPKLSKEVNGVRNYSDGRVAQVKTKEETLVYTYQDDISGHTVYRLDKLNKLHSVQQFQSGVLTAELDKNGNYMIYGSDGLVRQKVDGETMEVYSYEYTRDADQVIQQKLTYRSTARGELLYSTTNYSKDGGVSVVMESFEKGGYVLTHDGLMTEKMDDTGMLTRYMYKYNKKGEAIKQVGTTQDGVVTVVDLQKASAKKSVNFQKVLRAALRSVRHPGETVKTETKNGMMYEFVNGSIMTLQSQKTASVYHFLGGTLLETVSQGQHTVVRDRDGSYIRIYPEI